MAAGRGRDADRRGGVPLVLAAAVRVHVGVALHDRHRLGAGRTERHELGVEHARRGTRRLRAAACATRAGASCPVPAAGAGGGVAVESSLPCPGSATVATRRDAVERERDVHGPVGAAFAPLARAVERVDDPHAFAVEPRRASPSTPPTAPRRRVGASARRARISSLLSRSPSSLVRLARLQLEQELAGLARDVGGELVVVHSVGRRLVGIVGLELGGRGREQRRRGAAQDAGVDRLHEHEVDVGAPGDERVVARSSSSRMRAAAGGRPTPRAAGRSPPRRRPCCRSAGRARRDRARPRRTCRARPGRA